MRKGRICGMTFALAGAASTSALVFGGCVGSSSNPSGLETDSGAIEEFSGFDVTGIDVNGFDTGSLAKDSTVPVVDTGTAPLPDSATSDSGSADTSAPAPDTSTPDSATPDDATIADSGIPDTSLPDAEDASPPADSSALDSGAPAADAAPQLIADKLTFPVQQMVAGGGNLYWTLNTSPSPDLLGMYTGEDGGVDILTNVEGLAVLLVTVDSTAAYFSDTQYVIKLPFGSATQEVIGSKLKNIGNAYELSSDGTTFYFTDLGTGVYSIPATGTATAETHLFDVVGARSFAFAGPSLYVGIEESGNTGFIESVPTSALSVDGGAPADAATPIVPSQVYPSLMRTDGTHIFWLYDSSPGNVYQANQDGKRDPHLHAARHELLVRARRPIRVLAEPWVHR